MSALVNQPTAKPSNKLTAATLGALAVSVVNMVVLNVWPEWHDPAVFTTLTPVLVGLLGYVVRDAPNV